MLVRFNYLNGGNPYAEDAGNIKRLVGDWVDGPNGDKIKAVIVETYDDEAIVIQQDFDTAIDLINKAKKLVVKEVV
ncbi:hypothetical protein [Salmonella phage SSBI34]|nr:hypothetical protein [Salmonella phage SSBI34]